MNILFITIASLPHMSEHSISLDLIHKFRDSGNKVYVLCGIEKKDSAETTFSVEDNISVLRVKIGNNKNTGMIEKGITTLLLPRYYISAAKKYFKNIKFDLVLYPTPPVTHYSTVKYIKKRDNAKTYLLLKDIFPQNAVDIGLMTKTGLKGIIYKYFRKKEKKLYSISDRIGCMSQANVDYLLRHNPEIDPNKVEICPNSIEVLNLETSDTQKLEIRKKYNIPTDKKIFVYGGNLGKIQCVDFIVDCLQEIKKLENVFFLIIGDGIEYYKLERFINNEKPSNIRLMKRIEKSEYDVMVSACDIGLIFVDHRFTIPNFPSRLLGYMQAKLPVLATTDINTDIGKVITDGSFGWWCKSDNVEIFKNLVIKSIDDDLLSLGENAFKYLQNNYTVEKCYKIIMEGLYEDRS